MTTIPTSDETGEMLFVYGTLRPGASPNGQPYLVHHSVGAVTVSGVLYDQGDYPGAILNSNEGITYSENEPRIVGDVLLVTQEDLHRLDEYEEYKPDNREESLYFRKRVLARLEDGSVLSCWIYEVNLQRFPEATLITSGDWLEHYKTKTV